MPGFWYQDSIVDSSAPIAEENKNNINNSDEVAPIVSGNSAFLKKDILNADETSSGWRVFTKEITQEDGGSYPTINIATVFGEDDYTEYRKYLERLIRSKNEGFFSPDSGIDGYCFEVEDYRVFSFSTDGTYIPLKNVAPSKKKEMAPCIYAILLYIINSHKNSSMCSKNYVPLNCLSEENIYLKQKDDAITLKILPMVSRDKMNIRDIGVDLYDATSLYFSLRYYDADKFEDNEFELLIQKFFLPIKFKKYRPDFEKIFEIIKELNLPINYSKFVYDKVITPKTPSENGTGENATGNGNDDRTREDGEKASEIVEKIKEKAKGVFGSAFDKLSGMFKDVDTNIENDNDDGTVEN